MIFSVIKSAFCVPGTGTLLWLLGNNNQLHIVLLKCLCYVLPTFVLFYSIVVLPRGDVKKAEVLLPLLNKTFITVVVSPSCNSSIHLSLHHVYTRERLVILLVNVKEHIVGDVKLGRIIQKILTC